MKATVKKPGPLLDFMLEMMQTTKKASARQMLKFNGVKVDGTVAKLSSQELTPGQVVEIGRGEKNVTSTLNTSKSPIQIHYEDEAIVIAQKPAGLLTVSTSTESEKTMHVLLQNYMESKEGGRIHTVHRLDRNVGGIMVFAKTQAIKETLQESWEDTSKNYVALVVGKPVRSEGRVENWLEEVNISKVAITRESPNAKYCITEYRTLKRLDGQSLIDINLLTGRRHQIRVHLAHLGCPIVGDRVYGAGVPGSTDIYLFAYALSFRHPLSGEMVDFTIPTPRWDTAHPNAASNRPKRDKPTRRH